MKSYFEITPSSSEITADNLWLILQHGAGLSGYIIYAPDQQSVIHSQLWQISDHQADFSVIYDAIQKVLGSSNSFSKTILVNYNPVSMPMPAEVYHSNHLNQWLHLLAGHNTEHKVIVKEDGDTEVVYAQPIEMNFFNFIHNKYQNIIFYSLDEFAHEAKEDANGNTLRATFFNKHIFVSVYKEGQVVISQAYPFETPEDILYLLLNVVEQLSLELDSLSVIPEGFIDADSSLYKLLDQYFPNIVQPEKQEYQYPKEIEALSPYILRHIDRIITCVS